MSLTDDAFMGLNKILNTVSIICPRSEHHSEYVMMLSSINGDEQ